MPRIINFLGYNPEELSIKTNADKVRVFRRSMGLEQRDFAPLVGLGYSTIRKVEEGRTMSRFTLKQLRKFMEANP